MCLGCGTPAAVTGTHAVRCCSKSTKCPDRIANPQLLPSWSGHMKFGALLPHLHRSRNFRQLEVAHMLSEDSPLLLGQLLPARVFVLFQLAIELRSTR